MLLVVCHLCFSYSGPPAKENQVDSDTESDSSSALVGSRQKSPVEKSDGKSDGTSKKERKIKSVPKVRRSIKITNQSMAQKGDEFGRSFSFLILIK